MEVGAAQDHQLEALPDCRVLIPLFSSSASLQLNASAFSYLIHLHVLFHNMFGTLRYSSQNDDSEFIGRAGDASSSSSLYERGPRSLACDRCRSKKVHSDPSIRSGAPTNMLALPL